MRVLAEPTLVTVVGRTLRFRSGGEVLLWDLDADGTPVQRPVPCGTSVDFTPRFTGGDRLQLELRLECSEVDSTKSVTVAGKQNPAIRKLSMATCVEAKPGETCVFAGLTREVKGEPTGVESSTILILVTPEVVEPIATRR